MWILAKAPTQDLRVNRNRRRLPFHDRWLKKILIVPVANETSCSWTCFKLVERPRMFIEHCSWHGDFVDITVQYPDWIWAQVDEKKTTAQAFYILLQYLLHFIKFSPKHTSKKAIQTHVGYLCRIPPEANLETNVWSKIPPILLGQTVKQISNFRSLVWGPTFSSLLTLHPLITHKIVLIRVINKDLAPPGINLNNTRQSQH